MNAAVQRAARPMIYDAHGVPMRRQASAGGGDFAHAAASTVSQELATWWPILRPADAEYLPERDLVVARTRDTARNNGWVAGGLQRFVDEAIGQKFRLNYMPDARALGLDPAVCLEWAKGVERQFMLDATDSRCLLDAGERNTLPALLGLLFRHVLVDGECLAVLPHLPGRHGSPFGTCVQVLSPDRLSNEHRAADSERLRRGVEINSFGAPQAYWIQAAHPNAGLLAPTAGSLRWERVPRYTPWGRLRVIHWFEQQSADQSRGKSFLTPVLEKVRMVSRYEAVELQAAIVNAIFAAFITSPFDHAILNDALSESDGDAVGDIGQYQDKRADFHDSRRLTLGGVRIPTLFPGEKIESFAPGRPNASFGPFLQTSLRYMASALGQSYEEFANDWSSTNYSSARAAMLKSWKFLLARRGAFSAGVATPIFACWLEERMEAGAIVPPAGAPPFWQAFAAYTRCQWIGPGRGWVDPTKEAQAAVMRMDAYVSTLQAECAEQGLDYDEVLDQAAYERKAMLDRGLPPPQWAVVGTDPSPHDEDPDAADRAERGQAVAARLAVYEQRMADLALRAGAA